MITLKYNSRLFTRLDWKPFCLSPLTLNRYYYIASRRGWVVVEMLLCSGKFRTGSGSSAGCITYITILHNHGKHRTSSFVMKVVSAYEQKDMKVKLSVERDIRKWKTVYQRLHIDAAQSVSALSTTRLWPGRVTQPWLPCLSRGVPPLRWTLITIRLSGDRRIVPQIWLAFNIHNLASTVKLHDNNTTSGEEI